MKKVATPKEFKPTQAESKLLNEIEKFFYTNSFQKEIKILRERYHIPKEGFIPTKKDTEDIIQDYFKYVPKQLEVNDSDKNNFLSRSITKDININIATKFENRSLFLTVLIKYYLFFDKFYPDINGIIRKMFKKDNLIKIINFGEWAGEKGEGLEHIEDMLLKKPIGILLTRETSQRDLIDFIKKNWSLIEEEKNAYYQKEIIIIKDKNLRTATSKRAKIIKETLAKNPDKENKEIRKILSEKQIILEDGNIFNYRKKTSK